MIVFHEGDINWLSVIMSVKATNGRHRNKINNIKKSILFYNNTKITQI